MTDQLFSMHPVIDDARNNIPQFIRYSMAAIDPEDRESTLPGGLVLAEEEVWAPGGFTQNPEQYYVEINVQLGYYTFFKL